MIADIAVVLHTPIGDLEARPIREIEEWHRRAVERAKMLARLRL
jgi:hypothetical protein